MAIIWHEDPDSRIGVEHTMTVDRHQSGLITEHYGFFIRHDKVFSYYHVQMLFLGWRERYRRKQKSPGIVRGLDKVYAIVLY
jgi:hypothetical protein